MLMGIGLEAYAAFTTAERMAHSSDSMSLWVLPAYAR